jgi:nucleotide-binding universal stress UspA family protein
MEALIQTQCDNGYSVESRARPAVRKVLDAVDGSPASVRDVKLAIEQEKPSSSASLVLVNVQNFRTLGLAEGAGIMPHAWIEQEELQAAAQALQDATVACQAAGVGYVTRSEEGPVAATIDRLAGEENVDSIFMGTRGLGEVRGLLLGSVTTQLLHLAGVPVTLMK